MKSLDIKSNYLEFVFSGFFLVLVLVPKLVALYIGVIIISLIIAYLRKDIKFKLFMGPLTFVLLYFGYLVGIFWTKNPGLAEFYAVNKLSFLLFPLLLSFRKKGSFNLQIVFWGMIIATLISFLYGIYQGIPCYIMHGSFPYCFLKSHLSPIIHPTYATVLAQMSFFSVYYLFTENKIQKGVAIILLGILSLYIFLLLSLSGVIYFGLVVFGFVLYKLYKKYSLKAILIGLPILLILFSLIIYNSKYLKEDIQNTVLPTINYLKSPAEFLKSDLNEPTGSEVRLIMWAVTIEEIKKNPFGVGTGNIDLCLSENLTQKGFKSLVPYNYNPHNQFLQTTLELGFLGGILILAIFVAGFTDAWKFKNWLIFFLFSNLFFNSLFESMLQNQVGIVFYVFMYLLLLIHKSSELKSSE